MARTRCYRGVTPAQTSGALRPGRGDARKRAELLTQAEAQRGGLCGDEAGPVITFGTLASVVYGIVLMLAEQ